MKGRIKKTNQTMKSIKQNKKVIKWKEEKYNKNMQVLKDSTVKFVLALGVSLLTSFWICLWFSHRSMSYCLTLGGGKVGEASCSFIPAKQVCRSSQILQADRRELGSVFFFFPVVPRGWWLQ